VELRERMFAHRSLSLYGGHDDEINCLVFSRDFEILLTASINGFIRLWNTVFEHLTFKIQEKSGMLLNKRILITTSFFF
jgi:WD40 repeat protein